MNDHDFRSDASGVGISYSIYDPPNNRGTVCVGVSHDTAAFAAHSIATWWKHGESHLPWHGIELLILADAGGSNNCRSWAWKTEIQTQLCNQFGITITVAHYPTGASKWNPIEHRLFSQISKNWAGEPLVSHEKMLASCSFAVTNCKNWPVCERPIWTRQNIQQASNRIVNSSHLLLLNPIRYCRNGTTPLRPICEVMFAAPLRALEELSAGDAAQRIALSSKLEQLEYEAKKAFEQYDAVDARNRLVASELERRWNEKLENIEATKQRLASLNGKRYSLSAEEEARILAMGDNFTEIWQSHHCPPALKKMIFRTVVEEIVVRTDTEKKTLEFTVHWKGGTHTQLTMERPRSATDCATSMEALEVIRRMAVRHGDDQIASVLNRLGYSTGKSKRWNQTRVATARRNHAITGQRRALPDSDRVSLNEAARICGVSSNTIARLVEAGLLKGEQVTPRAPWGICRADLNSETVQSILDKLLRTGKLILKGGPAANQPTLFVENEGDDNAGHHE